RDRGRNNSSRFMPVERKHGCRETNARRNQAAEDHAAPAPLTSVRRSRPPASEFFPVFHVRPVERDHRRGCTAPLYIREVRTASSNVRASSCKRETQTMSHAEATGAQSDRLEDTSDRLQTGPWGSTRHWRGHSML